MHTPFRSKIPSKLKHTCFGGIVCWTNEALYEKGGKVLAKSEESGDLYQNSLCAHSVGDRGAHGSNHDNASTAAPSNHFLRYSLSGHEYSGDIHFEHHVGILGRVFQSGRLLLDASRCYQPIQFPLGLRDVVDHLVQLGHISNIDLPVVKGCSCRRGISQIEGFSEIMAQHSPSSSAARFCTR